MILVEDKFDENLIRKDFPITHKKIYMNNGSISPLPLVSIKAMTDFFLKYSEEGPDSDAITIHIESIIFELRKEISHLLNCDPQEVILTQSTTEGLNYVANGLDWKKSDGIIIRGGSNEHYANYFPWFNLSKKKYVKIYDMNIDNNGFFHMSDLEKLAKRKNVKLISLTHGLYNTGSIMPVEEVGKIARENDLLFCLDSAQTVGSIKVDVKKINCDFMAFPVFKWLCGPLGLGIFYCSKKSHEFLTPNFIGGESAIFSKEKKSLIYKDLPEKFQTGFRNFPGVVGSEASIRYLLRLGISNIRKQNIKLANLLRNEISKISNIKLYGTDDENQRTSIISFSCPKISSKKIVDNLSQNGIIAAERDLDDMKIVRFSPHFYNSEEEVIETIASIKTIINKL